MKTLSLFLVLYLLLSSCIKPKKDFSSPEIPVNPEASSDVYYKANLFSQAYFTWKSETAAIEWQESDPKSFELAEAYILGFHGPTYLGSIRLEILFWLLENFKTIQNPSPDSSEMKALEKAYINKDFNL